MGRWSRERSGRRGVVLAAVALALSLAFLGAGTLRGSGTPAGPGRTPRPGAAPERLPWWAPATGLAAEAPAPAPALLARVECRGLTGPCEYAYALINPAAAAASITALTLLEGGDAEDRSRIGWSGQQTERGGWRWEHGSGVAPGWMQGGFALHAEGLPKVGLAQLEAGGVPSAVPTLVPGPPPADLDDAAGLIGRLRAEVSSLAAIGWIAPGPAAGLLDGRLRAILELLERDQRTEALRRLRALAEEVDRLAAPASVLPGRSPGAGRPLLSGATPLAPETRDLFTAILHLALARLGAVR